MKQFYHLEHEYADTHILSVNRLSYDGKEVLLVGSSEPILVVAGFIAGELARQREGYSAAITDVEPITDDAQRKEISDLLSRKVTNKKVVFWNN